MFSTEPSVKRLTREVAYHVLYGKAIYAIYKPDMNQYMRLYGSTVISIRSMVNLMLETHVRYLFYMVIYCKQVLHR